VHHRYQRHRWQSCTGVKVATGINDTGSKFFHHFLFSNIFGVFFLFELHSALLHLPPLRFQCADGCWDRTQDRCNWCIDSQTLYPLGYISSTIFASVVDTDGKFATGVNDIGGKFAISVKDAGGKLPPVSTTPAANLPPV
jgi:hypothetical protein